MLIADVIRQYLGWCPNARAFTQHQQMDATGFPVSVTESEKPPSTGLFGKQNAEKYRHTQVGIVLTSCLIIGILGSIFDFFTNGIFGLRIVGIPFFLFMAGLLLTSTTLTVIIVDNRIELFLGPLPLRKRTIPLSEIMSVRVENDARHTVRKANWYLLLGAKLTTGEGLVIEQQGGRLFWIGSDEPEFLMKVIYSAMEKTQG